MSQIIPLFHSRWIVRGMKASKSSNNSNHIGPLGPRKSGHWVSFKRKATRCA